MANDDYELSCEANIDDVGGILELIEPLEQQGALVKRSRELLETEISQFRLLVRDGRIIACAALYPFLDDRCGEIACIVSHPDYRGGKRGQRLLKTLEQEARSQGFGSGVCADHPDSPLVCRTGFCRSRSGCTAQRKTISVQPAAKFKGVCQKPLSARRAGLTAGCYWIHLIAQRYPFCPAQLMLQGLGECR